jgi:hypothetical protein
MSTRGCDGCTSRVIAALGDVRLIVPFESTAPTATAATAFGGTSADYGRVRCWTCACMDLRYVARSLVMVLTDFGTNRSDLPHTTLLPGAVDTWTADLAPTYQH